MTQTHETFFKTIRAIQPQVPIIIISRPKYYCDKDTRKRREIILTTYRNAVERGDRNVYFIDGSSFFSELDEDYVTVDNCHPNDLGFLYMAKKIKPLLNKVLNL